MRETRLHISTRILSLLLAILLMLAAFLSCAQVTAEAYVTGTVTEATKMYDGPGTSSTHFRVVAALDPGDAVTILGNATGSDGSAWYQCCIPIGGTLYYGCVKAGTLTKKTFADTDTDFENYMNAQGFPDSYKPYLRVLHAKYPSWVFVADQTGLSWDDVIAAESRTSPDCYSSVLSDSRPAWISPKAYDSDGNFIYVDSGGFVAASVPIIEYYMDPRNSLDESSIFQFLSNKYDAATQTSTNLAKLTAGTFLAGKIPDNTTKTYGSVLLSAGKTYGANPLALASMILQEQGVTGSGSSISGTVPGYTGYYNFFNIGAYAGGGNDAVVNGLIYAKSQGWNTRTKSINGGAEWFADNYVKSNMYTLYYKKFNVMNGADQLAVGQYMSYIAGANQEGLFLANGYQSLLTSGLTFNIPVYKNMPGSACPMPSSNTQSTDDASLSSLKVSGYSLSPSFSKTTYTYTLTVPYDVTSAKITATASVSTASVSGTGTKSLKVGTSSYTITVKDGSTTQKYTVKITRQTAAASYPEEKAEAVSALSSYLTDLTLYREAQQEEIAEIIEDYTDEIEACGSIADIDEALAAGKEALDEVKTDAELTAEELAEAKEAAKQELAAYTDAADYREAEQLERAEILADADAAIDDCSTVAGITPIMKNAKRALDALKTDAAYTAEELTAYKVAAKAELASYKDPADYRAAEQLELSDAVAAGTASIEEAADIVTAQNALAEAKAVIDAIPTDERLTEELPPAQAAAKEELAAYKDPTDYLEAEQAEIARLIEEGSAAIDGAVNFKTLDAALAEAKAALDALLTAQQYLDAPVITASKNVSAGTQLTWTAVEGAESYEIRFRSDESDWMTAAEGVTATTYQVPKALLASGTKYCYQVRSAAGYVTGFSGEKAQTYLEAPVVSGFANRSSGTLVSWDPVEGASSYVLMYKVSGGSWQTAASGIEGTSYVVPKSLLASGTKYYYTLKAKSSATSGYTSGKSFTYLAAPAVNSTKNLNAGTQVTWSAVEGASSYSLMYREAGGSWELLYYGIHGTSFTVPKAYLESGTKYYYTVIADGAESSGYTSGKAQTYLAAPQVASLTKKAGGVTVSWNKVEGAASYTVMYKVSGGSWKTAKSGVTGTSYTVPKSLLTSGKKYYFTVKAKGAATSGYSSGKSLTWK